MQRYDAFYAEVIAELVRSGTLDRDMRLLAVCAGVEDRNVLERNGFEHVVISNVDTRPNAQEFAPFSWSYQDAESLTWPDGAFDFTIVHSGLHHCHSPHRALLEMYRVSTRGVVLFEPYDNWLTAMGVKLGIGQDYEHAAVFYNGCTHGGVRNGCVPNYIYRWTEKEIVKTISAFAPYGAHTFRFIHRVRIPWTQLQGRRNRLLYYGVRMSVPLVRALGWAFPKQCNCFAAIVMKPQLPRDLHPWLDLRDGTMKPNRAWLGQRYRAIPGAAP
jgi:SAM-dependent methyltransferase